MIRRVGISSVSADRGDPSPALAASVVLAAASAVGLKVTPSPVEARLQLGQNQDAPSLRRRKPALDVQEESIPCELSLPFDPSRGVVVVVVIVGVVGVTFESSSFGALLELCTVGDRYPG